MYNAQTTHVALEWNGPGTQVPAVSRISVETLIKHTNDPPCLYKMTYCPSMSQQLFITATSGEIKVFAFFRSHEKDQHTLLFRVSHHDERVQRILRVLGCAVSGRHYEDQSAPTHHVRGSMLQHHGYWRCKCISIYIYILVCIFFFWNMNVAKDDRSHEKVFFTSTFLWKHFFE